jgi:hypothetical protein
MKKILLSTAAVLCAVGITTSAMAAETAAPAASAPVVTQAQILQALQENPEALLQIFADRLAGDPHLRGATVTTTDISVSVNGKVVAHTAKGFSAKKLKSMESQGLVVNIGGVYVDLREVDVSKIIDSDGSLKQNEFAILAAFIEKVVEVGGFNYQEGTVKRPLNETTYRTIMAFVERLQKLVPDLATAVAKASPETLAMVEKLEQTTSRLAALQAKLADAQKELAKVVESTTTRVGTLELRMDHNDSRYNGNLETPIAITYSGGNGDVGSIQVFPLEKQEDGSWASSKVNLLASNNCALDVNGSVPAKGIDTTEVGLFCIGGTPANGSDQGASAQRIFGAYDLTHGSVGKATVTTIVDGQEVSKKDQMVTIRTMVPLSMKFSGSTAQINDQLVANLVFRGVNPSVAKQMVSGQ